MAVLFFMEYFVYILYSKNIDSYYVGSTKDLDQRTVEHNKRSGSNFTKRTKDWKLVYSESYVTRSEAQRREYEIKKKKSRSYIEWLITKS